MMAVCKKATQASGGWTNHVTWSTPATTGNAACASITGSCVGVMDPSGAAISCATSTTNATARCLK
jgi:hypothetical protein